MKFRSKSRLVAALLTVVALAPIGTSALASYAGIMQAPPTDPTTTQIIIVQGAGINTSSAGYSPTNVVVVIGVNNTIVWTNKDTALHTATSTTGMINSGDLMAGRSYTVTLTTPGTNSYFCAYHSWMHGTVVVKGNSTTTTSSTSSSTSTSSTSSTTTKSPTSTTSTTSQATSGGGAGILSTISLLGIGGVGVAVVVVAYLLRRRAR